MADKNLVSVVIPCYNEEKNIEKIPEILFPVLNDLNRDYEILAVDDGSDRDNTWSVLQKLAKEHPQIKAIKHSRNYGLGAAYQTAFDNAQGEYIILYSSDHEIPAHYIKRVVAKLDSGQDVVNTNRVGRWNNSGLSSLIRKFPSKVANWLIGATSGVTVKDTGSGMKGFRRFIIDNLRIYGDMHRFLPAYSSLYTQNIDEFDVEFQEREYGEPAYGSLKRTFTVFLDLFSMKFMLSFATKPFSMMPGRIFGTAGIVSFFLGSVITGYLFIVRVFLQNPIGDRPLLFGGLMLIIFGVQLIMIGLLGELLMRIYFESSKKTPYIVSQIVD